MQALGYLPPELPSVIRFGDNEEMLVTAKILGKSSRNDSGSMLHDKVIVFSGQLLDNTPAVAKIPATDALLQLEVCLLHSFCFVADLLAAILRRVAYADTVASWVCRWLTFARSATGLSCKALWWF